MADLQFQKLLPISKIKQKFSAIAIDQAHEQLNAVIKGDGGCWIN